MQFVSDGAAAAAYYVDIHICLLLCQRLASFSFVSEKKRDRAVAPDLHEKRRSVGYRAPRWAIGATLLKSNFVFWPMKQAR